MDIWVAAVALLKQNNITISQCYTARQYTDYNQQPGRRRMTALGHRWMRNPLVLQLLNHNMVSGCKTKATMLLSVRVKSKLQGKLGCAIVQSPETLSLSVQKGDQASSTDSPVC